MAFIVETHLEALGFNRTESRAYLCLAELGKASASLVAEKIKCPRSTAYLALENLCRRKVAEPSREGGLRYYALLSVDSLDAMLEDEERAFRKTKDTQRASLNELKNLLQPYFKSENYSIPRLQFFEGRKEVERMLYEHCLEWQKSLSGYDSTWWGYQDHQFVESYREWLDYYWTKMPEEENILLLSNESPTEVQLKGKIPQRRIRLVPSDFQFSSTIWVAGDYVITVMTRQRPHYAFQLQDKVFASNQRKSFQLLWKLMDNQTTGDS